MSGLGQRPGAAGGVVGDASFTREGADRAALVTLCRALAPGNPVPASGGQTVE